MYTKKKDGMREGGEKDKPISKQEMGCSGRQLRDATIRSYYYETPRLHPSAAVLRLQVVLCTYSVHAGLDLQRNAASFSFVSPPPSIRVRSVPLKETGTLVDKTKKYGVINSQKKPITPTSSQQYLVKVKANFSPCLALCIL